MECQLEKNKANCPCTYDCDKRGKCCECIAHHRVNNELPACYFPPEVEKTYNRSIKKFIEINS